MTGAVSSSGLRLRLLQCTIGPDDPFEPGMPRPSRDPDSPAALAPAADPATSAPARSPAGARRPPRPISLALQGGGALGAYTWGVLDVLLARTDLPIDQISGTSAGALNGAVLASALAGGGRRHAREALESFWRAVAAHPAQTLFRAMMGPVGGLVSEGVRQWLFGGAMLSPYQTDPLDLNPLRQAIAAHVDVDAIRARRGPQLFVTATHVTTGLPRVFGSAEMTLDALLASACLPQLFRAVEIDGEPYWDGGYVGNPTLWPLIRHGRARDLVLVQLAPDRRDGAPRSNASIRHRAAEIVFNSSLVAEMQAIQAIRERMPPAPAVDGSTRTAESPFHAMRFHRIGPPPAAALERPDASLDRSWDWIGTLRDAGRDAARRFLRRDGARLGQASTLDIGQAYGTGRKPRVNVPVVVPPAD
jgi:NTE family protein